MIPSCKKVGDTSTPAAVCYLACGEWEQGRTGGRDAAIAPPHRRMPAWVCGEMRSGDKARATLTRCVLG